MTTVSISVICATYNREQLVARAVQSVLAQTFKDFELIVVDDGSTDNTLTTLNSLELPDQVQVINQKHQGAAAAMNAGIALARGEYIMMLGSDDEMLPNCLDSMHTFVEHNRLDLAWSSFVGIDWLTGVKTQPYRLKYNLESLQFAYHQIAFVGNGWGMLARRDLYDVIGLYDESLSICVDADWMLRYGIQGFPHLQCGFNPEVLMKISVGGTHRISDQMHERAQALEKIHQKHGDQYEDVPRVDSQMLHSIATYLYMGLEAERACSYVVRAIQADPTNLHSYVLVLKILVLTLVGKANIVRWRNWRKKS